MKKNLLLILLILTSFNLNSLAQIGSFVFPEYVAKEGSCEYKVNVKVSIIGVNILTPYWDGYPDNTGSFPMEMFIKIENEINGVVSPSTATFWTFDLTMVTPDPTLSNITNNISNLNVKDTLIESYTLGNNPMKTGSLKYLGLTPGYYDSDEVLTMFNYDSMFLKINAPCLGGEKTIKAGFSPNSALSIDFKNFKLIKHSNSIQLKWVLGSNKNISSMSIEKSIDSKSWNSIANVGVNDNFDYDYFDYEVLNNKSFYRIKIIENNGQISYSKVINTLNEISNKISIYPNPACDFIVISNVYSNSSIQLINDLGRVVYENDILNDDNNYKIDVSKFIKGMYLLKVQNNNTIETNKVLIK